MSNSGDDDDDDIDTVELDELLDSDGVDDDLDPEPRDIPKAIKRAVLYPFKLHSNLPNWAQYIVSGALFFSGIYFGDQITKALNKIFELIGGTFGAVQFSAFQIELLILGLILGHQYRIYRHVKTVGDKLQGMSSPSTATDGGREIVDSGDDGDSDVVFEFDPDDPEDTTGGGALAGAIAGGAIGASWGPGGVLGGILAGAILGDNLERQADEEDTDS